MRAEADPRSAAWSVVGVLGIAAAVVLAIATRHGVGTSTDSIAYLHAAASLIAEGRLRVPGDGGEVVPLTRFPPLYPLLLAATGLMADSVFAAARIAAVVLLAVNVWLIGRAAGTAAPAGAAAVAAALAALSLPVVEPHAWAWSEPLFLACFLTLVLALDHALRTASRRALLISAAAVALLVLTRYAGMALAGAAVLAALLWARRGERVRAAAVLGSAAIGPLAAWLLIGGAAADRAAGRIPAFHPPATTQLVELAHTVSGWLLPAPLPTPLALLVTAALVAGVAGLLLRSRRQERAEAASLPALLLLSAGVYCGFIVASFTFFDADIPFDDRILLPVYCALLIVVVRAAAHAWSGGTAGGRRTIALLFGLLLMLHGGRTLQFLHRVHGEGLGYSALRWTTSEAVSWVRHNAGGVVYSNYADVLQLHTQAQAQWLPWKGDPNRAIPADPAYPLELERVRLAVVEGDAHVVLFRTPRRLMPDSAELVLLEGLHVRAVLEDGLVFGRR